jgi:hypothetical protein
VPGKKYWARHFRIRGGGIHPGFDKFDPSSEPPGSPPGQPPSDEAERRVREFRAQKEQFGRAADTEDDPVVELIVVVVTPAVYKGALCPEDQEGGDGEDGLTTRSHGANARSPCGPSRVRTSSRSSS